MAVRSVTELHAEPGRDAHNTAQLAVRERQGEETYRFRNIAGKLEADVLDVHYHREGSVVGGRGGSKVT